MLSILALLLLKISVVSLQPVKASIESRFWQITDMHIDLMYNVHGKTQYNCHFNSATDKNESSETLGEYGDYKCDPPIRLLEHTLEYLINTDKDPDFILWTGDNGPHKPRNVPRNQLIKTIEKSTELIQKYYPAVPILPVVGNHDLLPTNQMSDSDDSSVSYFKDLNQIWSPLLADETAKSTFTKGGYYSWSNNSSMRVLVLNTILWFNRNKMVTPESDPDPFDQFKWLIEEINEARKSNEKVLIVGHAPPGGSELIKENHLKPEFNAKFLAILRDNVDILSGAIFGHEHLDSFRILTKDGKPFMPTFLAPSITPRHFENFGSINPSIRKYLYDKSSGLIVDYDQYHMTNLTEGLFQFEYSFLKEYSLTQLTAKSLYDLAYNFLHDIKLFTEHYRNLNARAHLMNKTIDSNYRCRYVCVLTHLDTTLPEELDNHVETIDHCQEHCPKPGDKEFHIGDGVTDGDGGGSGTSPDVASSVTDSLPMIPILLGVIFGFSVLLVAIALIVNREHMCKSRYRRATDSPNNATANSYTYSRI